LFDEKQFEQVCPLYGLAYTKKFGNDQRDDGTGTPEFWPSTALRDFYDDGDLRRNTVYQQLTLTVARS
jgi:hypothetical protein